jgi:hypothetical protein
MKGLAYSIVVVVVLGLVAAGCGEPKGEVTSNAKPAPQNPNTNERRTMDVMEAGP